MLPAEAIEILDDCSINRSLKSRVNPTFTCGQVLDIVRAGILDIGNRTNRPLDNIMEKRVWQVVRNQRHPQFEPT